MLFPFSVEGNSKQTDYFVTHSPHRLDSGLTGASPVLLGKVSIKSNPLPWRTAVMQ